MIELFICAIIFTVFGAYISYQCIERELQAQIQDLIEEGYLKTEEIGGETFLVQWPDS